MHPIRAAGLPGQRNMPAPPETAIQKMTTHDKKTNGIHDSMSSAPTAGARPVAGSCPLWGQTSRLELQSPASSGSRPSTGGHTEPAESSGM